MTKTALFVLILGILVVAGCAGQQTPVVSHGGPVTDYVSLIDNLRAGGATVEPSGDTSQPFFSVDGQVITVDGADVQVFEYEDAAAADVEAEQISPDGSSVGTTMITWVAPPHFYKKVRLIVLYVGEDPGVTVALENVVGPALVERGPAQPPSEPQGPPQAVLRVGGDEQAAGIGTYCWTDPGAGVGLCVDTLGIPTAADPLVVSSPLRAELDFAIDKPAESISLNVIPVRPDDELEGGGGENRWWPFGEGDTVPSVDGSGTQYELDLDPGLYLLAVIAAWEGFGDVVYGFLVEVA